MSDPTPPLSIRVRAAVTRYGMFMPGEVLAVIQAMADEVTALSARVQALETTTTEKPPCATSGTK